MSLCPPVALYRLVVMVARRDLKLCEMKRRGMGVARYQVFSRAFKNEERRYQGTVRY